MEVFTPLIYGTDVRLSVPDNEITVISGDLDERKLGYKATVALFDELYAVIGRSCEFPGCNCDAEIIPVKH